MNCLTSKKFSFVSEALGPETFGVVSFKGSEAISRPYEFEVLLVSDNLEIDLGQVVRNPARIVIHRDEGDDVVYRGIIAHFEQQNEVDGSGFYLARLVPKLWWLSLIQHNQVILNKSLPDFIGDVLKDGGLTGADFEFRLRGTYPPIDFVCQYQESHLNFVSRWLEHEGIYYFFEQTENGEKVVFTDTAVAHVDLPQGKTLYYSPPSGLDSGHRAEAVKSFNCRQRMIPGSVFLKDYNYMRPSLDMTGTALVDANGRGRVYYYNENFQTREEGDRLAKIRAEGLLCRREEFRGEGTVPYMVPGFAFEIRDHYRRTLDRRYLATEVDHEGNQTGYLISGIQAGLSERESRVYYRNYFSAIHADVQFRPEIKAQRPRISGTIVARIDAAGSGKYAELDEQGRYKIILPFDLSGHKGGKGSAWVRMAQPYAGSDHGMHFPLHKDTEVLLSFIDGDPDRPIIASAVPNPETPSPVRDSNQTMSQITTAGGNRIHMEDEAGSERILFHSPKKGSSIRIGTPEDTAAGSPTAQDASTPQNTTDGNGVSVNTEGNYFLNAVKRVANLKYEENFVSGYRSVMTTGISQKTTIGYESRMTVGQDSYTTVGMAATNRCGTHETFIGWRKALIPFYNKVAGVVDYVFGTQLKVVSEESKIAGTKTDLAAEVSRLAGEIMEIKGSVNRLNGSVTDLAGDIVNVAGNVTYVESESMKLQGVVMEMASEETKLREQMNTVCMEVAIISESSVDMAASKMII